MSTSTRDLVAVIEAHGIEAAVSLDDGDLYGLARWTTVTHGGQVTSGQTWERIDSTVPAVLAWLGY